MPSATSSIVAITTSRINLSPFTKDCRVVVAFNATVTHFLGHFGANELTGVGCMLTCYGHCSHCIAETTRTYVCCMFSLGGCEKAEPGSNSA